MEREKLTFWGILIEGIKKFAGEIVGVLMLALFLYFFPNLRSLFTDYNLPGKSEQHTEIQRELELHKQEEERLKAELKRKEDALKEAEEARQRAETQKVAGKPKPASTRKLPAMSDSDFVNLCESGNVAKIEEAIKNGANVNAKSNYGRTALMEAARYGRTKTAELLLKHGADVNAKESDGSTALIWAICYGYTETAEVLLNHGADVNAKDNTGSTALMLARHQKNRELLRKYGAR